MEVFQICEAVRRARHSDTSQKSLIPIKGLYLTVSYLKVNCTC